ncbi:MAG: hypothetical protein JNN15_20950 [Blastocatellia bacterium]|nr:hypothetical protein [Blastocatellia bacterium]
MSKKSVAGTYEVEVLLGTQQVCILELDIPDTKNELLGLKYDTPSGQEALRGMLAGIFSTQGDDADVRQLQVYDLLEGISTIREAIENAAINDSFGNKLASMAEDDVAQSCIQFFFFMTEQLNRDKLLQILSQFSKFLLTKKEALPKVASPAKTVTARWDRVIKQNVFTTDELNTEIEVNPLEEGLVEEAEATEGEWSEPAEETETDELTDNSEIP